MDVSKAESCIQEIHTAAVRIAMDGEFQKGKGNGSDVYSKVAIDLEFLALKQCLCHELPVTSYLQEIVITAAYDMAERYPSTGYKQLLNDICGKSVAMSKILAKISGSP